LRLPVLHERTLVNVKLRVVKVLNYNARWGDTHNSFDPAGIYNLGIHKNEN